MRSHLTAYAAALGGFLAVDAIWLSVMGPRFYRAQIGDLLLDRFAPGPAIAFYAIFGIGLVTFAVMPGVQAGRIGVAVLQGALFGLVAYATYDLTNQATLKGWPVMLTVVDMAWGTVAAAIASGLGAWAVLATR